MFSSGIENQPVDVTVALAVCNNCNDWIMDIGQTQGRIQTRQYDRAVLRQGNSCSTTTHSAAAISCTTASMSVRTRPKADRNLMKGCRHWCFTFKIIFTKIGDERTCLGLAIVPFFHIRIATQCSCCSNII